MTRTKRTVIVCTSLLVFTGLAAAQGSRSRDRAVQACRDAVASKYSVDRNSLDVKRGEEDWNSNAVIQFRGTKDGQERTGQCSVDRNNRVTDIRLDRGTSGSSDSSSWGGKSGTRGGWDSGSRGRGNDQWADDYRKTAVTNFPRVRVDTAGKGSFGELQSGEVRRGYVDTRSGAPSVAIGGRDNTRVTFTGDIIEVAGRRMVMRINSTSLGTARGRVEFELNSDQNEVQFINVRATVNGRDITANFTR